MISPLFFLTNIKAKPLKIILTDECRLRKIDVMSYVKNWIWNNIIDTKLGWHDDIQCVIDEIDVDQLMSDRAEEYNQGVQDTYD